VARSSEPIFNIPPVIAFISAALVLVHGARALLAAETEIKVLMWFAFVPARYDTSLPLGLPLPGGVAAEIWTFVSYAFLHGDIVHLLVNLVWFLAFGSAVAWRFGALRFLVFFAVTAAAGALTHLVTHYGEFAPLVGSSAAISGAMAAAVRFAFADGGPLGFLRSRGQAAFRVPAAPLLTALRNPQVIVFLAVWFVLNLAFGASAISDFFTAATIAWEAHIGGFLAGLLLFPLFDPVGAARD
jgi:membrane associated rhomboid family serine protease